jgi:hypothetical protein
MPVHVLAPSPTSPSNTLWDTGLHGDIVRAAHWLATRLGLTPNTKEK